MGENAEWVMHENGECDGCCPYCVEEPDACGRRGGTRMTIYSTCSLCGRHHDSSACPPAHPYPQPSVGSTSTPPTPEALRAELEMLDQESRHDAATCHWANRGAQHRAKMRSKRRAEIRAQLAALEAPASEEPTDYNEPISDAGHTVGMLLEHDNEQLRAALQAEREQREAVEAELEQWEECWVSVGELAGRRLGDANKPLAVAAQAALFQIDHTTTRNALRELVEAWDRGAMTSYPETTVEMTNAFDRARALLAKEES